MGYAVAEAAWSRGANVVLISGPVSLAPPVGVQVRRIETTKQLEAAVREELAGADVLVMAAAPADFRPSTPSDRKQSRIDGAMAISMEPTDDILAGTREARRPGSVIVGFALETGDALAKGRAKLERKALDLIVVNDALEPGAGFEVDTNRVALVGRNGAARILPLQSKLDVAEAISMPWRSPLADEWRRYLAQQIELGGAESILEQRPEPAAAATPNAAVRHERREAAVEPGSSPRTDISPDE